MKAEYKLGNFTPKGWILKCAHDAYNESYKKPESLADIPMQPAAFEKAIYAALDAAKEVGFFD